MRLQMKFKYPYHIMVTLFVFTGAISSLASTPTFKLVRTEFGLEKTKFIRFDVKHTATDERLILLSFSSLSDEYSLHGVRSGSLNNKQYGYQLLLKSEGSILLKVYDETESLIDVFQINKYGAGKRLSDELINEFKQVEIFMKSPPK